MARESRRKREARRFGTPGRLADRIDCPFDLGPVIEATNVFEYYRTMMGDSIDLLESLPCVRPPFPRFFVEMRHPIMRGMASGWAFEGIPIDHPAVVSAVANFGDWPAPSRVMSGHFFFTADATGAVWPRCEALIPMGEFGELLANPALRFPRKVLEHFGEDDAIAFAMENLVPALLAVCFMNCRNVSLDAVEPDVRVNRERVRHGRKPFVRYHTINIEPMKRALRVEGNAESVGLKRALHIVRGHLCTLTRNNKGETLEKPTLYYREAHARGSLKEGVVVSDYRVKP